MRRAVSLLGLSFRIGVLNALQYRTNFVMQLIQSVFSLATALGAVAVVFGQTDSLGGWRRDELVALIGVFIVMRGLVHVVIQPSMERLLEGIRQGTLDFTLTKPADAQLLVSIRQVEIWRVVDIAVGVAVLVYALSALGNELGIAQAAAFAFTLTAGIAVVYSFLLILCTLGFWLVRLENLLVLFSSMYEAGRWPVGIYPPWLAATLTFVVPIAFAITIPVESLTGRLEPLALAGTAVLAAAFVLGSRWFWRFGLRNYTGASA